jgi:hypothetical protein
MDIASVVTLVLLAAALAAQPWSVLASVLLVTSERGLAKVVAYVAGWTGALAVVAALTVALYPEAPTATTTSPVLSWIELLAGLVLASYLVVRSRRPVTVEPAREPKWMDRINSISLAAAFVLGAFLPNYVLVVAAVDELLKSDLSQGRIAVAAVVFVILSSLGVAAPLLVLVFRRQEATQIYAGWHTWLVAHAQGVVAAVLWLLAIILFVKGVVGLLS